MNVSLLYSTRFSTIYIHLTLSHIPSLWVSHPIVAYGVTNDRRLGNLWVTFAPFYCNKRVDGNPRKLRNRAPVHPQHRPPLFNFIQVHNTIISRFPLQRYHYYFIQQNKIAIYCDSPKTKHKARDSTYINIIAQSLPSWYFLYFNYQLLLYFFLKTAVFRILRIIGNRNTYTYYFASISLQL